MTRALLPSVLFTCILCGTTLAQESPPAKADDLPGRTAAEVYADPDKPLDDRIDQSKVTESDLPELPTRLIRPQPPVFRIAASADELPIDQAHYDAARAAIERGVRLLLARQGDDGSWMSEVVTAPTDHPDKPSPVSAAVTAMIVKAILQSSNADLTPQVQERVARALNYVRQTQNADGSFEGGALSNYVTATIVSALAATEDNDNFGAVQDAVAWLKQSQWDQTEGINGRQDWFGGAGYGNRGRPDLSNTQLMLDALHDANVSPDEPAVQRALAFVSRTQNLDATNDAAWAGDDGGFVYTPANGGESMGSEAMGEGRYGELIPEGEPRSLRSYGSMTYAGFKSMIYAGLDQDDIRVKAAFDWLSRHWTFDENPGLGQQGLYYYYTTMARAMAASQQDTITDSDGVVHNWREELIDAIVSRQEDDGRWVNGADRWLEGRTDLATAYAILALEEALKPTPPRPE